jgi:outer membrane protein assembly factor BamB
MISTDGERVYAGSLTGVVYAVDAASGAQRWAAAVGPSDALVLRPVVRDGVVYVGLKRLTAPNSGAVAALDALTGAVRWKVDLVATDPGLPSGCLGPAVFYGDMVIMSVQDGSIRALDRATGQTRWVAPRLSGLPSGAGGSPDNDDRPLTVAGSTVVAGSTTGYLVGLDAASGAQRWRVTANRGSAVYPLATDGATVYVVYFGGQLAAVRASDGAALWSAGDNRGGAGAFAMTPAVDLNRLYISGRDGYYALRSN